MDSVSVPGSISVSAVVIAYNERRNVETCLRSLAWADEILWVDAFSDDGTAEIARGVGQPWSDRIRVVQRKWDGFRSQRNFAIREAKHDWVLVVDADEECTPQLANRVRELLARPGGPDYRAYKVRRVEYLLGREIKHGMWNPSYQDRFFHRLGVEYVNEVHEYPVFAAPPGIIQEPLLHNPQFSIDHYMAKLNRYTTVEAQDRYDRGKRTNAFHLIFTFPAMSLKSYFYYGAYKDGFYGIIISLLEGVSRVVRHIKIWQIMERKKAADMGREN